MYGSRAEAVQEWLTAYRKEDEDIDERLEKIRELRSKVVGIKAQEITDMPKSHSNQVDSLAEYVIRLEELEGDIEKRIHDHERDRRALLRLIHRIADEDERNIIRFYYLYRMRWSRVQLYVYHNSSQSDRRKMFRRHRKALEWMGKFWSEK